MDDILKHKLIEYGEINRTIKDLKTKKETIKTEFKNFLEENNYSSKDDPEVKFDCQDSHNDMWRLNVGKQERITADWDYLKTVLTSDQIIKAKRIKPVNTFKIGRIKTAGNENDATQLSPPSSNYK